MSKFAIDTDKVKTVANDMNILSSRSSTIVNSISSYDTTNEDGFDFNGAKGAIENNVEGMKIKVNNTSVLLEAVVGTHSSLQDSVSNNKSSGSSSKASSGGGSSGGGGYGSSSSGGGSGSGGGYVGGPTSTSTGFGNVAKAIPNKTEAPKKVEKAPTSEKSNIDYASSFIEDPYDTHLVETALKDNPSAYEKLKEELGNVESAVAPAESVLNEELAVVLSANNIKTINPEDISTQSFANNLLIIEASSKDIDITKYLQDVNDVAKGYEIEVKFLELDGIISSSSPTSLNETNKDDVLSIKEENNTNSELESDTSDPLTIEEEMETFDENREESEILEVETKDGKEVIEDEIKIPGIITGDSEEEPSANQPLNVAEDKQKTTENKEIVGKSAIVDQIKYDRLTSIPAKNDVKNDILNSPVTLVVRNNLIINSATGILGKEMVEMLIASSGINKRNI